MNAYAVRTKDARTYVEPILDDGSGPSFDCQPLEVVVAATPAKAKQLFLAARPDGVDSDDWPNLRVRILFHGVDLLYPVRAGVVAQAKDAPDLYRRCWGRIHEIEDHGGKPCDCPTGDDG